MLAIGINLIVFLYTLPGEFILYEYLQETWIDLSQGFLLLVESLSKIGGAVIVLLLIFLSLILIFGSIYRLSRLFFTINIKPRSNRKIQ